MLFAKVVLYTPDGREILMGHRVPDGAFSAERLKALLANGWVVEGDTTPLPTEKKAKVEFKKVKTAAAWNIDPAELAEDSLEILNMKAVEHAKKWKLVVPKPFDDVEDAVVFMTAEFQPE